MSRLLVDVTFQIDPDLLKRINHDIYGKTQSEKLRRCVREGYAVITTGTGEVM
jgi:hypothetical protein